MSEGSREPLVPTLWGFTYLHLDCFCTELACKQFIIYWRHLYIHMQMHRGNLPDDPNWLPEGPPGQEINGVARYRKGRERGSQKVAILQWFLLRQFSAIQCCEVLGCLIVEGYTVMLYNGRKYANVLISQFSTFNLAENDKRAQCVLAHWNEFVLERYDHLIKSVPFISISASLSLSYPFTFSLPPYHFVPLPLLHTLLHSLLLSLRVYCYVGYLGYAGSGKNSRGTQLIMAFQDNKYLGGTYLFYLFQRWSQRSETFSVF